VARGVCTSQGAGLVGVAQLQFQCTDEGERYLLDLDGRFYWSLALAVNVGLNLPAMWASLATNRTVEDSPPPPMGTRYQWLGGDLQRAFKERRGGLLYDLMDTLSFARSATHSSWDRDDVRPSLHLLSKKFGRVAGDTLRHLANRSVVSPEPVLPARQQQQSRSANRNIGS
jgi:hypothetical protein